MKPVKVPAFELFLHEMIPLARAMGVSVELSDGHKLVLTAPAAPNKNSLNTAFGGSLVSLATLAGYGVVWELMRSEGTTAESVAPAVGAGSPVTLSAAAPAHAPAKAKATWHIVVKESRAAYRRPVLGDLRAVCERPAKAAIEEFKAALARYGKAKLKLHAKVVEGGNTAVDVQAAFVVSR